MQILISSVSIPDRVRKDLGDLQSLMESLQRCGQLNPITVTREMVLIAGHRRFEAASRLGWRMIDATVVDGIDEIRRLEIELEENIHRKDFSPEELLAGVRKLDELRRPKPLRRFAQILRKTVSVLAFWRYFGKRKGGSGHPVREDGAGTARMEPGATASAPNLGRSRPGARNPEGSDEEMIGI